LKKTKHKSNAKIKKIKLDQFTNSRSKQSSYHSSLVCLDEAIQEGNSFIWSIWNSLQWNALFG